MLDRLLGRPATCRRARSRGAATLEYAAAIALVALLAGAVVIPMKAAPIAQTARAALCKVYAALGEGGACDTSTPPAGQQPGDPPMNPKPPKCKITEHGEKVNAEVKIAFISIGENAGFVETTYSDGTVTYTATDGASVGLTGGFGTKLDVGKVERGAKVDFGGDLKFDYGSTWTFKDGAEATAMKDQLNDYLAEQAAIKASPTYAIKFLWSDPKEPPKPPNLSVSTIEVAGSVDGHVGLSLPYPNPDPTSPSGIPNLKLTDFGLKFGGSNKWTQITDTTNGSKTYTTSGEGYGEVHGTVGPLAGELRGVLGSSLAVTRDKDNQVTKVTLVTTREGKATSTTTAGQGNRTGQASDADAAGAATITTTSLDVSTPEQRSLVDAWLAQQANDPAAYVSPETYFPNTMVAGDPFQNLMFTNGIVSNVEYANVSDKQGFAAEVKLGVAFGIDLSLETNDSKATAATYLDVPTPAGTRPPVGFPECVSK